MSDQFEQLSLPMVEAETREVSWYNSYTVNRRRLFGKSIIHQLEIDDTGWPTHTRMRAADIGQIVDTRLRYALRFADAANAMGWMSDDVDGVSLGHFVQVHATREGLESRFLNAIYTGVENSFEDDLKKFEP